MFSRMSRFLVPALLLARGVCAAPIVNMPIDQPTFKDPYNGDHDALLDIDIQTPCVSNLIVQVHLPQTFDATEATATLTGPSFGPQPVQGISSHPFPGHVTTATIQWDNTAKVLTFSDFVVGGSTHAVDGLPGWINLNFDIPDNQFGTVVPLTLVGLTPPPGVVVPRLKINLNNNLHFNASASGDQCTDGNIHGDPVFAGFQHQKFQFHGLPDEYFNLVSSPNVSVNAHFVYLSSGKCDYTDTECFTHPGTYMDVLGFSIADSHVKVVAGTHEAGLRVWVDDVELTRGERTNDFNTTASVHYHHKGRLEIQTDIMGFHIANSDMFVNIKVSLNDPELLRVGAARHTVTDKPLCKTNSETSQHQLVESVVAKKYPVTTPLHGLIGQTWRNVKVCGRDWMGTTNDYLVSDLFATDNHYNYFHW